ncbi:hypothetical protein ACJX0J_022580, partial [Zea mays]
EENVGVDTKSVIHDYMRSVPLQSTLKSDLVMLGWNMHITHFFGVRLSLGDGSNHNNELILLEYGY